MSIPRVNIGMISRGADINVRTLRFLMKQHVRKDIDVSLTIAECSLSAFIGAVNLFDILMDKLDESDYTYITDTDIVPPDDVLDKLMACKKDVVLTPVWHYEGNYNDIHLGIHYNWRLSREHRVRALKHSGMEKVAGGSLSSTLIDNKVLKLFKANGEHPVKYSKILHKYNIDRENPPNDNVFFFKCRHFKIQSWVCWDVKDTMHYRSVALCNATLNNFVANLIKEKRGQRKKK